MRLTGEAPKPYFRLYRGPSFQPSGKRRLDEKMVAWFYRVLRHAVIDHYRSRSAADRAHESWAQEFPDRQEPAAEMRQEICQCISRILATLKPEYREALRLIDIEDGRLGQLADAAGITAENAAVRVHRARKAPRRQVELACGTCAEHGCLDCRRPSGCGTTFGRAL